jgi:hypothetical protein
VLLWAQGKASRIAFLKSSNGKGGFSIFTSLPFAETTDFENPPLSSGRDYAKVIP